MAAFFDGKKTYLLAVGAIFLAIGGFLHGDLMLADAVKDVIAALMGITIRHGIG